MARPSLSYALLLAALIAALVALNAWAAAPIATGSANSNNYKPCGSFTSDAYTIRVFATRISCATARRIQRELWNGNPKNQRSVNGGSGYAGYILLKRFPGWKCTSGSGGGQCQRGRKYAHYQN